MTDDQELLEPAPDAFEEFERMVNAGNDAIARAMLGMPYRLPVAVRDYIDSLRFDDEDREHYIDGAGDA